MAASDIETRRNRMPPNYRYLYTFVSALLLVAITVVLLYFANDTARQGFPSAISDVLIVLIGMTSMVALLTFQAIAESDRRRRPQYITFNSMVVLQGLAEAKSNLDQDDMPVSIDNSAHRVQEPEWELTAGQLVGLDHTLALAKLRLDLESELRRIANEANLTLSLRPAGITNLADELARKELIPRGYLPGLQEIAAICNRAIHGMDVSKEAAVEIVSVGGQLLEQLRLLHPPENESKSS